MQSQKIRQSIRQQRRALSKQQQTLATTAVLNQLQQHPRIQQAKHVAIFLAVDGEINTTPIINWLGQNNKNVYLPLIHPFSPGHLLFSRYYSHSVLTKGAFNIPSLELDVRNVIAIDQLDVVITPLVAFNSQGYRLGMGGGYYDRTLVNWPQRNIYPIGIAHDLQHVESLPVNVWDVPLAEIVTPSQTWTTKFADQSIYCSPGN